MAAAAASLLSASPRASSCPPANSWPFICKKSDPANVQYVNAARGAASPSPSASSASSARLCSRLGGRNEKIILVAAAVAAGGSTSSSSSSSSASSAYSSRSWTDEAAAEEEAADGDDDDAMAGDADLVAMDVVDLYEVLGVESSAKQEEIRRSYRWLQKKCHPDIAGPALGHSMAILLNHAYKTLSDPNQRAAYDQQSRHSEDIGAADDLDGYTGMPLYSTWVGRSYSTADDDADALQQRQAVFVDENRCVGCLKCALIAPRTFAIETRFGRARAVAQCADPHPLVEDAIHACPVDCISWVDRSVLPVFEFAMSKIPRVPVGLEVHSNGGVRSVDVFTEAERLIQKLRRRKDLETSSSSSRGTSVKETLAQRRARVAAMNEIQARAGRWWYDYLGAVAKSSSKEETSASSFQRKAETGAIVASSSSFFHARSAEATMIGEANIRYIMEASRRFGSAASKDYSTRANWSNHHDKVKYKHRSTEDCEYWVQGPVPDVTDINMALHETSCDNQRISGSSDLDSCNLSYINVVNSTHLEKNDAISRSGTGSVKMRTMRDARLAVGGSSRISAEDLMMWRSVTALWMSGAAASYVATTDQAQKLLLPALFNIADNVDIVSRVSASGNGSNADMIIGVGPIPSDWMQSMEMHVVLTAIVWYLVGAALGSLLGSALMFARHEQHASDES